MTTQRTVLSLTVPRSSGPGSDRTVRPSGGRRAAQHRQPDVGLRRSAVAFAVGALLHNGDHFRRGLSTVTPQLQAVGWLGIALSVAAVVVVLTGHRTAPLVAVSAGFPLALGFTAAHWLPHWSSLSDSFVHGGASWISIVASLLEISGALWLGFAGVIALRPGRRPGRRRSLIAPGQTST